jgi:hypothetical protein
MNSHTYRRLLMKSMYEFRLVGEQKFLVFFLFSMVSRRDKVLRAMDGMAPEVQAKPWFNPVKAFVTASITDQWVPNVSMSTKFPATKILICNPGLDLLLYCYTTDVNKRSIIDFFRRPTASQLHLNEEMQKVAKEGYKFYGNSAVSMPKNASSQRPKSKKPVFKDEYYFNYVKDDYKLRTLELKEIPPNDKSKGYSAEEIVQYVLSIKLKNECDEATATVIEEMSKIMMTDIANMVKSASN